MGIITYQDRIREYLALWKHESFGAICHPSNVEKFKEFPEIEVFPNESYELDGFMIGTKDEIISYSKKTFKPCDPQ